MRRYYFDDFVLSPRRRLLLRDGSEQPLIPRYFDLLVFLVEHRHEAVHRHDIFERVWSDAVVSDSALSQAIRTIRRVLGDDPKEPRYIRTVSRHGYRFVFTEVREEDDDGPWPPAAVGETASDSAIHVASTVRDVGRQQDAAALLHLTAEHRTAKWAAASGGGALAGLIAGVLGGTLLAVLPGSGASFAVIPVLGFIGACCGAVGGAGVGAGLSAAEARTRATLALVAGAAAGGGIAGTIVQWLGRWSLAALVGVRLDIGGGLEGVLIGGAAGLAYGLARAGRRLRFVMLTSAACGLAALVLSTAGRPLVSGTLHAIATGSDGAQVALTPLGQLMGESEFGPLSSAIIGTAEGVLFGLGLALGLTRRPDSQVSPTSHTPLTER